MVDPQSQRIARLTPLGDALAQIDRLVAPIAPRRIALAEACGCVLAGDIVVGHQRPTSAIALRDGVAVRAEATLDASAYAPIMIETSPIEVGDPLPAGADAVAPAEAIEIRGGKSYAAAPLAPGDNVLPAGADGTPGDALCRVGARLRAGDLAVLSALGIDHVAVRAPRIGVLAANPRSDIIIDAIVSFLARAVAAAGARVAVAPPDRGGLDGVLDRADAVIVVGGSGSGRRDASVRGLARLGQVAFHGVGLAPGETAAFGIAKQRPVLVVPGRLDAALAVWLTLGRRMVARLCGGPDDDPATPVTLTHKIASTLGLAELVPVARAGDGVRPLASGYLTLQSLARADGYVLVPADSEGCPPGARVDMRPLP